MCEYAGAETAASAAATEAVYSVKNATTEATQQPSMQDGHRSVYAKNIMAEHVAKQHADAVAARGERKTTGRREAAPQQRERTVRAIYPPTVTRVREVAGACRAKQEN